MANSRVVEWLNRLNRTDGGRPGKERLLSHKTNPARGLGATALVYSDHHQPFCSHSPPTETHVPSHTTMAVITRSATRRMNVPTDSKLPRASTSKAAMTQSRTVTKRTRKVVKTPTSVVTREDSVVTREEEDVHERMVCAHVMHALYLLP